MDDKNHILFLGWVLNNKDPLMLGRIRVVLDGQNYEDTKKSIPDWNEERDSWSAKDPFLFLPLLPYYLYQVPEEKELIQVIYSNKDFPFRNQYYVQGPFSSPTETPYQFKEGAKALLASGENYTKPPDLRQKTGEEKQEIEGIYPLPTDNALMGRGSADLIIKRDTALLRAGKILTDVVDKDTRFPFKNFKRSFLQLSLFKQTKVLGEPETKFVIQESISEVKKIVIWDIQNLENNVTPRMYSGSVGLYNVKASKKTNSQNFKFDSIKNLKYGEDYTGPIEQITFSMKNTQESVDIINSFIKATFDGYANIPNFAPKSQNNFLNSTPFVVTPSEVTYSKGQVNLSAATLNDLKQFENFTDIFARVTLTKGIKRGFFLVSGDQDGTPKIGPDYKPVTTTETPAEYFDSPITYGILGGQKIYLLSQDSDGPNGKINLADTLYGLEQDDFIGDGKSISTKTYPMVRGDVLMELIDKLFSFVAGHVHPASGSPPDTKSSGNGITVDDITEEIANASQTILNQEIRIN